MTPEALLRPRYKVIAEWPGMHMEPFSLGQVVTLQPSDDGFIYIPVKHNPGNYMRLGFFALFPHLFKKLVWWEERKPEEFPEYVKLIGVGCTIEKDGVTKVLGTGYFEDNGRNLGNEGQPYVLIADKYAEEYGHTRLNCRNCIPATLEEYETYLKSKT